jgi:hypothetical protein
MKEIRSKSYRTKRGNVFDSPGKSAKQRYKRFHPGNTGSDPYLHGKVMVKGTVIYVAPEIIPRLSPGSNDHTAYVLMTVEG